jgi:hypothetical protein
MLKMHPNRIVQCINFINQWIQRHRMTNKKIGRSAIRWNRILNLEYDDDDDGGGGGHKTRA